MKKNYSQKFFQPRISKEKNFKDQSIQKNKQQNAPQKKTFTRKPAGGYLPLNKKRVEDSINQVDTTFQQSNISEILQKSKKVKFISCRSQASLGNSIISNMSTSLSFAQSFNDTNEIETTYSRLLMDQSIIPEKDQRQSNQRQIFRRKTIQNTKSSVLTRKKTIQQSLNTSIMDMRNVKKHDKADQQTKLQSSQLSQISKTFCKPYPNIMNKNIILGGSKNSSKQSMRKSNSSNSLIKRQTTKCQQCEFHKKQIRQLTGQNSRLQRILKNKEQEIIAINKKFQQNQKRSRQLERKIKEIQKSDYQNKFKNLQEQFTLSQQQCIRTKESFTKTLQELKYKSIENNTLKKYQVQCQSLERKVQMLVAERNQLRQRLSNIKVSQKSSYMNYPTSLSKNQKIQSTGRLPHSEKKRDTYTSRGQDEEQQDCFEDQDYLENNQNSRTQNDGFMKKKPYAKCYDDSSESEIISLSQQSTY